MFTHKLIHKALAAAFVLSATSLASAHNFPRLPSKAEIAAERAASCKSAVKTGAGTKRSFARFGPTNVVTTGSSHRVAGAHRFGGRPHVPAVACTRPTRNHVACL